MLKIYTYKNCSSCQKTIKFLREAKVEYQNMAIRETPPTEKEIFDMLRSYHGNIKEILNTSGEDYRRLDLKSKLAKMSTEQIIQMMSANGNLIKRPFILNKDKGIVGFNPETLAQFLKLI